MVIEDGVQLLIDGIQPILVKIGVIVGSVIGIYILLILIRIYYERKSYKILRDIRYDLDQLNTHYNLPNSTHRKGLIRRFASHVRNKLSK